MFTTNNPPTSIGNTKIQYGPNGELLSQTAPPSAWDLDRAKAADNIRRPQPATPKTAEQLQAELEANQNQLDAALEHFSKWQHKDEYAAEKRELKMFLAEFEQRVKESRERLTELESADSPATKLTKNVARIEVQVSHLAREAQLTAANKVALAQFDQPYSQLTGESQREIMTRQTILTLQHIASNAFHGFGRLGVTQRTVDGAQLCTSKIKNAFTSIGEVIAKACK
jgi:molecular chaperone GrpE (heat shock protein)